ncbi:MAG TPA: hypothetical protein VGG34_13700 [Opitutaceae bacterium]|jgi:hypothetical protein
MSYPNTRKILMAPLALSLALGLTLASALPARADAPRTALDDKAPAMPVTATFDKGTDPNLGPYILNLRNDSKDSLKVSVTIHLSVAFHASRRDRTADHAIDAGQIWTVQDLAANDKVTVTAGGYAPLNLTVP